MKALGGGNDFEFRMFDFEFIVETQYFASPIGDKSDA
ncbi:MAG: hypothetical protein JWQ63_1054 [Mucilaginibacter sp.]|nr:hypothetical protein [Mucilaginibacter sp.]